MSIKVWKFNLLISLVLVFLYNAPFWREVLAAESNSGWKLGEMLVLGALVVAVFNLYMSIYSFRYVHKAITILLFLIAAVTLHFMQAYGVMVDRSMIVNVLQTDVPETAELIDMHLILYVAVLGVLPACLIGRTRILYGRGLQQFGYPMLGVLASLGVIAIIGVTFFEDIAPLFREHREIRYLLNPSNVIYYSASVFGGYFQRAPRLEAVGVDARLATTWKQHERKTVLVIVLGETAREKNFSLGSYDRQTNPLLVREAISFFPRVSSCGTATASSLPCMFSKFERRDFTESGNVTYENLLDVTNRAGLRTLWVENSGGCKGLCDRIEFRNIGSLRGGSCQDECYDENLVAELEQFLASNTDNAVVVLHQQGSHGPAYYRRVPDAFRRFMPVCKEEELRNCTEEEIVNAYDNSILYTDYVLFRAIEALKAYSDIFDTALIYVSDHGESLGEKGVYLHGLPYAIAPAEQTLVPMLVWLSAEYQQEFGVDGTCVSEKAGGDYSHDNFFHSILGLLDINTAEHDPVLDIFAECHRAGRPGGVPAVSGVAPVRHP